MAVRHQAGGGQLDGSGWQPRARGAAPRAEPGRVPAARRDRSAQHRPVPHGQPRTGQAGQGQAQPTGAGTRPLGSWTVPGAPRPEIFAFSGPDRETVAAQLARVTGVAAGLSDSELGDLACQLGRQAAAGPARVAVVAASQDELARLTREAADLLPGLASGQLTARPGLFAADGAAGRVVLLPGR